MFEPPPAIDKTRQVAAKSGVPIHQAPLHIGTKTCQDSTRQFARRFCSRRCSGSFPVAVGWMSLLETLIHLPTTRLFPQHFIDPVEAHLPVCCFLSCSAQRRNPANLSLASRRLLNEHNRLHECCRRELVASVS